MKALSRRQLIQNLALVAGTTALPGAVFATDKGSQKLFEISLAQWSLHRSIRGGKVDALDFARYTKKTFGIHAIEYVNQFYFDTLNEKLIQELRTRADGEGVRSLLIMCDREGALGDADEKARIQAVQNHYRWADAAHALGCHSIRVNAQSAGTWHEQVKLAADGLNRLAAYCEKLNLNVIVENHGGFSSNGAWLSSVMKAADNPRVGTLPDFGNFVINRETGESYDKYLGMEELLPWAKALSAKSFTFNSKGEETTIDFFRMMKLAVDAKYSGFVGIEYEGENADEVAGIKKTQKLLERVRTALA